MRPLSPGGESRSVKGLGLMPSLKEYRTCHRDPTDTSMPTATRRTGIVSVNDTLESSLVTHTAPTPADRYGRKWLDLSRK